MKGNGSIGNIVTMGEFPLYGCTNIQKKHYEEAQSRFFWDEEIRNLMEHQGKSTIMPGESSGH